MSRDADSLGRRRVRVALVRYLDVFLDEDLRDDVFLGDDFFDEDFLEDDFLDGDLRDDDFFDDFFAGTLPPALRASDRPIAIACLRLVTFLPDRPLRNVPLLRSCIAFFTFDCALLPYLAMMASSIG